MATLDAKTIAGVAVNAGFKGQALTTAVAIALAESSGNPAAHNRNASTGDDSYGLWQINMLGSLGPARRKLFDISDNNALLQANQNADAAFKIYQQSANSFSAWSTYKSNAYKSKLAQAQKGVTDNGGAAVSVGTADPPADDGMTDVSIGGLDFKIPDIGSAITGAMNSFSQNIFKVTMNISGIVVGIVLLILGVVILMRAPITSGAKAVVGIAGPGKVAKAAGKVAKVGKAI